MVLTTVLASCAGGTTTRGGERVTVAVAFYPIEEIVRRVGGDELAVQVLVEPGTDPHEFDLTPRQLAHLASADVVFYLGDDFQPSLEKAIRELPADVRTVDLLADLTLREIDGDTDPHVWLDPRNMAVMSATVAAELSAQLPNVATTFDDNAAAYIAELDQLHAAFDTALADCAVPVLITTHDAFGYLADAYELTEIAIAGVSPADEPSAKTLRRIAERAADEGVTTVFFEENLPDELATTIAAEIGARVSSLGTVESLTQRQLEDAASYLTIMSANLEALRAGLGCR